MRWLFLFLIVGFCHTGFSQTYQSVLSSIKAEKDSLFQIYNSGDSITKYKVLINTQILLYDELINNVFPQWYGTEWDYEGYTNTPKKGQVACGYFVSTPLKHIGFNLNRYKLAQKYSHAIVKTLCTKVQSIGNNDTDKLFAYIKARSNQLYVVGLDNHVGFISKESSGIYFIHSSYLDPVAVIKEKASESDALIGSSLFVLGHFSANDAILRNWLTNEPITILQ